MDPLRVRITVRRQLVLQIFGTQNSKKKNYCRCIVFTALCSCHCTTLKTALCAYSRSLRKIAVYYLRKGGMFHPACLSVSNFTKILMGSSWIFFLITRELVDKCLWIFWRVVCLTSNKMFDTAVDPDYGIRPTVFSIFGISGLSGSLRSPSALP